MVERNQCPECGSWDTERANVEWVSEGVEETRVCDNCPTTYSIDYGNPIVNIHKVVE